MTKVHAALVVATAALSPRCSAALSLLPRHQRPLKVPSGGGLFGKRTTNRSTQQWMLPKLQPFKLLSGLQSTKEKEDLFFSEASGTDGDDGEKDHEKSWPVNKPRPPADAPPKPKPPAPAEPSAAEKMVSDALSPLLDPTIAKAVPPQIIQGAAINGAFLVLLVTFTLFGPFSVTSISALVAAASAAIVAAYASITEGDAGEYARGVGRATMAVADAVTGQVKTLRDEREVNRVADALLRKPKVVAVADPPKRPKWAGSGDSLPLTEGLTAEEAEEVRVARLVGGGPAAASAGAVQTRVTEGQTAEQAEESRMAREEEAGKLAKERKAETVAAAAASVDYDAAARLAYEASGSSGDFGSFRDRYLADTSAAIAKKHQDGLAAAEAKRAADEAAQAKAEEEARVKVEEEAQAKAAAEEAARIKAEEEAKAAAEEAARIKAEEEAKAKAAAEEAARIKAEEEAKAAAEEAARIKAEEVAKAKAAAEEAARIKAEEEAKAKAAAEEAARIKAEEVAKAKAAAEEARLKAEEEARAMAAVEEEARLEAEARKMEEARLAKLAEEEEQRRLEEQAEAAREAVRLMEEQEALMDDEDEDDDFDEAELDDDDWEASVRLANELQGTPSNIGGDVLGVIGDDLLRTEIDNLTAEEEDALGKAAREAVRKYEEEMAMKQSLKNAVRSAWDDEMVTAPTGFATAEEEEVTNGSEEVIKEELAVDYSKMTVAQLKDVLRSKGLKVSGRKAELIERLESS